MALCTCSWGSLSRLVCWRNDAINTEDGRYVFGLWSAKINGSYDGPWGLKVVGSVHDIVFGDLPVSGSCAPFTQAS